MRIAICDDSPKFINEIKEYISLCQEDKYSCDSYLSGEDLLGYIDAHGQTYDVIFMDMEMEGINGIDTAIQIRSIDRAVLIIFVTSHSHHMQRSFKCSPFRFLIKPLSFEDFKITYAEICTRVNDNLDVVIFLEDKKRTRVFCSDIVLFESSGHNVIVHTQDGKAHKLRTTINKLEHSLDKRLFVRVHRAFIVNLSYIFKISETEILLHDYDKSIPIGRTYKLGTEKAFIRFRERRVLI